MNKLLEIKNLSLSYKINNKSLQILKNVNIDLNYKEAISVIGESGSGKTSLIMLIAGLEKFNSGELIFDGYNFKNLNEDELSDIRRKNKCDFIRIKAFLDYYTTSYIANLISLFSFEFI